jgi:tellurite resistance protein TehA-like permease
VKAIRISLTCGVLLTAVLFALHTLVLHHFSHHDKPMMPNFFTYFLLAGYRIGELVPMNHVLQLVLAVAFDSLLFGCPVWVLLVIARKR